MIQFKSILKFYALFYNNVFVKGKWNKFIQSQFLLFPGS